MIFTKPRLTFYSEHPEITDNYPILKSKDIKRKWVKKSSEAFKKYDKVADKRTKILSSAKCPAVRSICTAGYVITTWCDFTIETDSSKPYDYNVYYPDGLDKFLKEINYTKPVVSDFNMKDQPVKIPTYNSHGVILKVWSPWVIDIPRGWEIMFLPIQYPDEQTFTALGGIVSDMTPDLNIHILWHETNGRVHIPAGTPLCQIVPIKRLDSEPKFSVINDNMRKLVNTNLFKKFNKF